MAEMTVADAIRIINKAKSYVGQPDDYCSINLTVLEKEQIAALIEQQAVEIERLRLYRGCLDCRFNDSGIINNYLCHGKNCVDFDKWLEKEAQGVE